MRMRCTWGAVLVVTLLPSVLSSIAVAAPPAPRATLTIDQIRAGVAQAREQLRSLQVEYIASGYSKDGDAEPVSSVFYVVVAARGIYRFVDDAHAHDREEWAGHLERNRVFFTGKTLDVFYPNQLLYETSEKNARMIFALKLKDEFFFNCLGWWPPDDPTLAPVGSEGRPHYLHAALAPPDRQVTPQQVVSGVLAAVVSRQVPSLLASGAVLATTVAPQRLEQPDFRVLPFQEQVDDAWCHVIEQPGRNRLWIDPEIGFGVRRREVYAGKDSVLVARYQLSVYRKQSGAWIPWKLCREQSLPNPQTGVPNSIKLHAEATVVRVEVNETSEDFFRFQPPPGTLVKDRDTGKTHQVPGGLAFLDSVIEATAARRGVVQGAPAAFTESDRREAYLAVLTVSVVLALNGWLVWSVWRERRRGKLADVPLAGAAGQVGVASSRDAVRPGTRFVPRESGV